MMRARLVRWRIAGSLLLFAAGLPAGVAAQGVTTAAIDGFITQETGEPIAEANIVAVHLPSGTQYHAVARTGGAYTIANMRIGGPYKVTASYIGFEPKSQDSVFLSRVVIGGTDLYELNVVGPLASEGDLRAMHDRLVGSFELG